jgi:hypothetical protein
MARTLYKGPALGKLPPCMICAGPGEGARERLQLTQGVSVWLCAAHRSPAFLARRAGRDLAASLGALWSGAGCLTTRRRRALEDHLRRMRQRPPSSRPGSYAWPELSRAAERRFSAGEPPARVIGELRARHRRAPACVPSVRTMRRWFSDGRWLAPERSGGASPARPAPGRRAGPDRRPPEALLDSRADERHPPPGGARPEEQWHERARVGGRSADPRYRAPPRLW